ncbi:hypothetical protein RR46_04307 [Papilio xuthus]|uniref:Uncharacterized protein n=1 Tax=Papilio xuthus TaxID=66420 RepID=A0A194QFH3_PAPXU|nr:hypothetical protein RR46_04307 [Papilio xuthus]
MPAIISYLPSKSQLKLFSRSGDYPELTRPCGQTDRKAEILKIRHSSATARRAGRGAGGRRRPGPAPPPAHPARACRMHAVGLHSALAIRRERRRRAEQQRARERRYSLQSTESGLTSPHCSTGSLERRRRRRAGTADNEVVSSVGMLHLGVVFLVLGVFLVASGWLPDDVTAWSSIGSTYVEPPAHGFVNALAGNGDLPPPLEQIAEEETSLASEAERRRGYTRDSCSQASAAASLSPGSPSDTRELLADPRYMIMSRM